MFTHYTLFCEHWNIQQGKTYSMSFHHIVPYFIILHIRRNFINAPTVQYFLLLHGKRSQPCRSRKSCTVDALVKFGLLYRIIAITRPEGASDCKIHHKWEKMDITSGDESAQRATSDVHLLPRVMMYFCNHDPQRGE